MNLLFDVYPVMIHEEDNTEQLFDAAVSQARLAGIIKQGDKVVLTAGVPLGESGNTNMVRVIDVK
jgi:pyruvate kinase